MCSRRYAQGGIFCGCRQKAGGRLPLLEKLGEYKPKVYLLTATPSGGGEITLGGVKVIYGVCPYPYLIFKN